MKRLAFLGILALCLAAPAAAAAPSPSAYRSHLNSLCRSYTPKLHALEARMKKAQQAQDWHAFGRALGAALSLALAEDAAIERMPVPTAMRARMARILRMLKAADAHARRAVQLAVQGDNAGFAAELAKIDKATPGLNRRLDAAGLRDCGSNQS